MTPAAGMLHYHAAAEAAFAAGPEDPRDGAGNARTADHRRSVKLKQARKSDRQFGTVTVLYGLMVSPLVQRSIGAQSPSTIVRP
jgi:hypothetical protein